MKKCGYSFWGYLGDVKYDKNKNIVSTPDGNAFYSWCIIRELQKRGYEVVQVMPDRDVRGYELHGDNLFNSWLKLERSQAYNGAKKIDYSFLNFTRGTKFHDKAVTMTKEYVMEVLEDKCKDMEFILHEYRMLILGRNDIDSILNEYWQPDYLIQECIFDFCIETGKRLVLFDLDYKLDYMVYKNLVLKGCKVVIFELGKKWEMMSHDINVSKDLGNVLEARKVYIPFDFDNINYFDLSGIKVEDRKQNLIYIGNRYERDWCIDKYMPENLINCTMYGNWLENNRDSVKRWSNLNFGERLQTIDMVNVYQNAKMTILFAKREYCEYGFMTARIIESIFYGTIPLFIEEYGETIIKEYAGDYAEYLTVTSKKDVKSKIRELKNETDYAYLDTIEYLREHLKFMDVKNFVDIIEEVK